MKTFWIMWVYLGNHSTSPIEISAASAKKAAEIFVKGFSEDFRKKSSVFVFAEKPVLSYQKGEYS